MRLFLGIWFSLCCFAADAQPWPAKPVRMIVAYPPGGGIDILARQLADKLATPWGQPVIVENKPGANTIVAADAVAKSSPDGHTLLMGASSHTVIPASGREGPRRPRTAR